MPPGPSQPPFDPAEFKAGRPQFAALPDAVLDRLHAEALMMTGGGTQFPWDPPDVLDRKIILETVVCHLAELERRAMDGGGGGVLASASEGSVSVSWSPLPGTSNDAYWNQTACGQTYLALARRKALGGMYVGMRRKHGFR